LETVARILIVDDENGFRRAIRIALHARGHQVIEAANGLDALTLLRAELPELILLDWQMPGFDGLATCRAIRASSDVPIVIVTSHAECGRDRALAAGATGYITKPFALDELLAHVRGQ
jgi:DNA-binding response OmpR family regulator